MATRDVPNPPSLQESSAGVVGRSSCRSDASKMISAASAGDVEAVDRILGESPFSIHELLKARGTSVLHEAAKAGHVAIVEAVAERRADVRTTNRGGCTPLHFATLCEDKIKAVQVADCLISLSCVVNAANERRDTALHYASCGHTSPGSEDVVLCLLRQRANVNARNRLDESPLMNASLHNCLWCVTTLCEHGADVHQKNTKDKTALDIAEERKSYDVVAYFESHKDPMKQLTEVTQQMRATLNQMHNVQELNDSLKQQTMLTEAYEQVASQAMVHLGQAACARTAALAIEDIIAYAKEPGQRGTADATSARLLQNVLTLQLICRTHHSTAILLHSMLKNVLPHLEKQDNAVVLKAVQELRQELKQRLSVQEAEVDNASMSERSTNTEGLGDTDTPSAASTDWRCSSEASIWKDCRTNPGAQKMWRTHNNHGVCTLCGGHVPVILYDEQSVGEPRISLRGGSLADIEELRSGASTVQESACVTKKRSRMCTVS